MKTSDKLLMSTGICIVLGILFYAFVLRGAYQKALANPSAHELRIDLKAMKHLNLSFTSYLTLKQGKRYEIVINKADKDSIRFDYQGDTANFKIGDIGNVTIYLPQLPMMTFTKKDRKNSRDDTPIYIDSTFQSGDFVVTSLKNSNIEFRKCHFDKVDVQSKERAEISVEGSEIKLLNLSLPKNSTLNIIYSNILAKNIILGDSCEVTIIGNQSFLLK